MAKEMIAKNSAAPKAGAAGAAWAALIIRAAVAKGEAEEKQAGSRKERLSELMKMTREDRVAVLARFGESQQEANAEAKALGVSLNDYLRGNTVARSVYQEVSLWKKLCKACDTGWAPNLDHAWNTLVMAATDRLAAVGAREAKKREAGKGSAPGNVQTASSVTRKGRKRQDVAKQVTALIKQQMPAPAKAAEGEPQPMRDLASIVEAMLTDATLEETRAVAAVVQRILTAKETKVATMARVRGAAAKTVADNKATGDKPTTPAGEPAPTARRNRKSERPTA